MHAEKLQVFTRAGARLDHEPLYTYMVLVNDAHARGRVAKNLTINTRTETFNERWIQSYVTKYRKMNGAVKDSSMS